MWSKYLELRRRPLPLWASFPLTLLGLFYVVTVPFIVVFDLWSLWYSCLIFAAMFAWWLRRVQRRTGLPPTSLLVKSPAAWEASGAFPTARPAGVSERVDAGAKAYSYLVHNSGKAPLSWLALWHADGDGKAVSTVAGGSLVLLPDKAPVQLEVEVRGEPQSDQRLWIEWKDSEGTHRKDTGYDPAQGEHATLPTREAEGDVASG